MRNYECPLNCVRVFESYIKEETAAAREWFLLIALMRETVPLNSNGH